MTEPDDDLERRQLDRDIAKILAKLELLSHGAVQAWNASGSQSGEPDDRVVSLVAGRRDDPPHLTYRRRYERCVTNRDRARTVADAEAEHATWVKRADSATDGMSDDDLLTDRILEKSGWSAREVALSLRTTVRIVRRVRVADGRDGESGLRVRLSAGGDRAVEAREMFAAKMSTREIAFALGVHQTQVMRWIRKAA